MTDDAELREPNISDTVLTVARLHGRIAELEAERDRWKEDYGKACELVAEMHAAAVGKVGGPFRGVVEDVEDLRTERDRAVAEASELRQALVRFIAESKNEQVRAKMEGFEAGGPIITIWRDMQIVGEKALSFSTRAADHLRRDTKMVEALRTIAALPYRSDLYPHGNREAVEIARRALGEEK